MSRPDRPVDKFGFPIPVTFNEPPAPRKGFRLPESPHSRRAIGILAGVIILGLLAAPWMIRKTRGLMADVYLNRALDQFNNDDVAGALDNIDRAIAWHPDDEELLYYRAEIRLANHDLDGALADANELLAKSNNFALGYRLRSMIHHQRKENDEAIKDATEEIKNSATNDPMPLNNRAYYRALAGKELTDALADIQQALEMHSRQEFLLAQRRGNYDLFNFLKMGGREPAFLDTRGYIKHKLGDDLAALADFNKAIAECEKHQKDVEDLRDQGQTSSDSKLLDRHLKSLNIDLAVMYHHRGETQAAMGKNKEAENDLAVAQKLGYDPDKGVE